MVVAVQARGLDKLQRYFERFPKVAEQASRLAVNDAATFGLTSGKREIRNQVSLSSSYLNDPDKIRITKRAKGSDLEAVIVANARPISLARFAQGSRTTFGKRPGGIKVRVKARGGTKQIGRGFLIRLRSGAALDDANFNVGLAVRLKKGERVRNKKIIRQDSLRGLALLYGPSVNQVFRTVAPDITPAIEQRLRQEFLRQFARLSRG